MLGQLEEAICSKVKLWRCGGCMRERALKHRWAILAWDVVHGQARHQRRGLGIVWDSSCLFQKVYVRVVRLKENIVLFC